MKRILKLTALLIVLLLITIRLLSKNTESKTETPKYEVVHQFERIEIRQYPDLVLASTVMGDRGYSRESGNGFRTVASYIFGGNETSEQISMTAPVIVEMADTMRMSFIMPAAYELDHLPIPKNPQVFLHQQNPKTYAVIQYGGYSNDKRFEEHRSVLEKALKNNNIQPVGPYLFFGYNPPYELINRRNEVAVEINWND